MRQLRFAAGAALVGMASAALAQTAPPPAVGVLTVSQQPVYAQSSYVGRIQSPQIVQLNARVNGYLEQQAFIDGDTVQKGQLLYVIEQPPYQAAVAQAQAALEQAQAQARNADLVLDRARALLRTPAGQQSTVDAAAATAQSDTAQIDSAGAQLETAQINLGYTRIVSPIDGQIGATQINVGNVVGPNSGVLATIVAEDPMYVTFSIPVPDAVKLRAGSAGLQGVDVLVQLQNGKTYPITGRIDFVNNQITPTTDTLNMRATVANPLLDKPGRAAERALYDGEFINVMLRNRASQQQISIPPAAVVIDQLGDYVLVVDAGNTVQRQNVTLGQSTPQSVVVLTGLRTGQRIIVDGIQRVHPGIKVNPQPADSQPATAAAGG